MAKAPASIPPPPASRSAASLILVAELAKLGVCVCCVAFLVLLQRDPARRAAVRKQVAATLQPRRAAAFALPAMVYSVENNLRFSILRALASPVTWVVWSHVEIPVVALLSRLVLGRRLSPLQARSRHQPSRLQGLC